MAQESNKNFNYGDPQGPGGWVKIKPFTSEVAEDKIEDRHISRENPRVSIPSPFARIQLIKDAFKVCAKGFERAEKRDRLLVSQTLDILELLYEDPTRQGIVVDVVNLNWLFEHLKEKGSSDRKQGLRLLGHALETYANNETNGLMNLGQLYILRKREAALAMSCPTSIMLPSPNYKFWETQVTINGDKPIFSEVKELYQRDFGFIKYLYTWFYALKQKNDDKTPEPLEAFGEYLGNQFAEKISKFDESLYHAIEAIDQKNALSALEDNYVPLDFNGVEIIIYNLPLMKQANNAVASFIESASDLTLQSRLKPNAKPLVLSAANTTMQNPIYTSDNVRWDPNKPGFTYNDLNLKNQPIEARELPNGTPYPHGFIYEHDFLDDCIFKLPYKLNSEERGFFDGNIDGCPSDCGFIPPIKMKYFEYFTIDDLKKNIKINVSTIRDRFNPDLQTVNQVQVILKLPVKGGTATFRKTYEYVDQASADLLNVESSSIAASGIIVDLPMAISIFPFVRFKREEQNNYTIQFVRDQFGLENYKTYLNFYHYNKSDSQWEEIRSKDYIRRVESKIPTIVNYSIQGSKFSFISIKLENIDSENKIVCESILIPDFAGDYEGNQHKFLQFSFDFGTSNTYVAVKENDDEFIDFKLPVDLLVSTISNSSTNLTTDLSVQSFELYSKQEIFPKWVRHLPFPIASVLGVPKRQDSRLSEEETQIPLLASYIPFLYGYEDYGRNYNEIISGLKWSLSRKNSNENAPFSFINELMLLAQAFAVSKDVNLAKCQIIWTYPLSMGKNHINSFQKAWEEAYRKYFAENDEIIEVKKLSESITPMLYHLDEGKTKRDTALSIDIGGGTCDIVVVPDGKIKKSKLTSIGFGADTIFGIDKRVKEIKMIENAIKELKARLESADAKGDKKTKYLEIAKELQSLLDENKKASEATGTLFNLQRNEAVKDIAGQISYNRWLKEKPFYHNIFQYYYAALIYFLTKLCEKEECIEDMRPRKIYFSGSGSKMLDIIDSRIAPIDAFTTALYNHFSSDEIDDDDDYDIDIVTMGNLSKEITAKGSMPSKTNTAIEFRDELADARNATEVEKKYSSNFKMLDSILEDEPLLISRLDESEIIDEVTKSIVEFHESFLNFIESEGDDYQIDAEKMTDDFLGLKEKKIRRYVKAALENIVDETPEKVIKEKGGKYSDVPFFAGIKNIIQDVISPD